MHKHSAIYAEILEDTAREQYNKALAQPFVVAGALMPDAHTGYSLPIGAVVACRGHVVPSYVGYDIGCGMSAQKLSGVTVEDIQSNSNALFKAIYTVVPTGSRGHADPRTLPADLLRMPHSLVVDRLLPRAAMQLASLGSGNHFIEIGYDENGAVWIIVHSGSRGFGHKVASHYMRLAETTPARVKRYRKEAEQIYIEKNVNVKKHNESVYYRNMDPFIEKAVAKRLLSAANKDSHAAFDVASANGDAYLADALFAQEYALYNRAGMVDAVIGAMESILEPSDAGIQKAACLINKNHNHVVSREIAGELLYIHRKGATQAEIGMLGVIPGNMRDGSFIVRGKGCANSLFSSSHGAGRVMSRKTATSTLSMGDFESTMSAANITAKVSYDTLDESPAAYKNIFEVMDLQKELVDIVHHIKPIINIKE